MKKKFPNIIVSTKTIPCGKKDSCRLESDRWQVNTGKSLQHESDNNVQTDSQSNAFMLAVYIERILYVAQ